MRIPCQHSSHHSLPIKAQSQNAQKVLAITHRTHGIILKYLKPPSWHQEINTNIAPRNLKHLNSKAIILNQDPYEIRKKYDSSKLRKKSYLWPSDLQHKHTFLPLKETH